RAAAITPCLTCCPGAYAATKGSLRLRLGNTIYFLIIAGFLLVAGWGYWALRTVPIDAIPDLSDNQVIVFSDWAGRSPQEVEDQITYPLTVGLQGLPGVRVVRSSSAFGFSMINVLFEDAVDIYFARTRVLERLNLLNKALPSGVVPTLGPDATGAGHVFWYTVEGPGYALRDLRSLQDWFIRYQLNAVPGVAEVASVGGLSGSIRLMWSRTACAPSASRSRRSWTRSCGVIATSGATLSRRAAPGRWSVGLVSSKTFTTSSILSSARRTGSPSLSDRWQRSRSATPSGPVPSSKGPTRRSGASWWCAMG